MTLHINLNLRRKMIGVALTLPARAIQAVFFWPGAFIGAVLTTWGFLDVDFAKTIAENMSKIGHEDIEVVANLLRVWEPYYWVTVGMSALVQLGIIGWNRYFGLHDQDDLSEVVLRIKQEQEPSFVAPKEIRAGDYFRVLGVRHIGPLQRATRDAYEVLDPKNKKVMRWNIDAEPFGKRRWPESEEQATTSH